MRFLKRRQGPRETFLDSSSSLSQGCEISQRSSDFCRDLDWNSVNHVLLFELLCPGRSRIDPSTKDSKICLHVSNRKQQALLSPDPRPRYDHGIERRILSSSTMGISDSSGSSNASTISSLDSGYASGSSSPARNSVLSRSPRSSSTSSTAQYECLWPGCTHISSRPFDLQRHMRKHDSHPIEQKIDCPGKGCGRIGNYGFDRKDHLREHLRNFHTWDIPKARLPRKRLRTFWCSWLRSARSFEGALAPFTSLEYTKRGAQE